MIFQELYSKKYVFVLLRSYKLEIVLALLTEVIIFYMQMTIVQIGVLSFEKSIEIISSFDKWGRRGLVSDCLYTNLHKLLE